MNTLTNNVVSKVNNYLYADKIRESRKEYIKSNGVQIGTIRTPFDTKKIYYAQ